MKRFILLLALGAFAAGEARASYRAYILWVVHYRGKTPVRAEKVVSTLDPIQYEAFHGLTGRARVYLLHTWYCPGDTSRREVCDYPRVGPTRGPASTAPKRGGLPYHLQPYLPR